MDDFVVIGAEVGPVTKMAGEIFFAFDGDAQAADGDGQLDAVDVGEVFQRGGAFGESFVFGWNDVVFEADGAYDQGRFVTEVGNVVEQVVVIGSEESPGDPVYLGDVNLLHDDGVVFVRRRGAGFFPGVHLYFLFWGFFRGIFSLSIVVGGAVGAGLGAEIALVLEDVGAVSIEAALGSV